jgi:hypothetical protein
MKKGDRLEIKNSSALHVDFSSGVNPAENIFGKKRHADFRAVNEEREAGGRRPGRRNCD